MSNGNFPNEQNLSAGAIPMYITADGQPVSSLNPLPTTASAGVPSTSVVTQYVATANGTGYSTGDRLQNVVVYNTGTGAVIANIWVNLTTSTSLSAPPTAGTYEPYSPSVTVSGFTVQNIEYTASLAGTGWAIGDYLLQTQTFDSATKALISTIWWNITQNAGITSTVPIASIVPFVHTQEPITGIVTVEQSDPTLLNATVIVDNIPDQKVLSTSLFTAIVQDLARGYDVGDIIQKETLVNIVTGVPIDSWINLTTLIGVNSPPAEHLRVTNPATAFAQATREVPRLNEGTLNALSVDLDGNLRVVVANAMGADYELQPPTETTLGGVFSAIALTDQFVKGIDTDGNLVFGASTLPIATDTVLGGVKVGTGLTIDASGELSSSASQGPQGIEGKSAFQIAVENGFIGTEQEWLDSLEGEAGMAGVDGVNGVDGVDGKSAYEVAVENGFVGTELQWLSSLKGEDGNSAYEIAVVNGFTGTEDEWLASLKGEQGEQGIGLRYVGRVPTNADLTSIVDPVHGDIYIADDNGNAYVWNSAQSTWDDAGKIVGEKGETGNTGPAGVAGPTAVSTDANNGAYLGTDNLIYVQKPDDKFLPLAGGTLTGNLNISGPYETGIRWDDGSKIGSDFGMLELAGSGTSYLRLSNGTITSGCEISCLYSPSNPDHLTNKYYVDKRLALEGGTMTGSITFPIQKGIVWDAETSMIAYGSKYVKIKAGSAEIEINGVQAGLTVNVPITTINPTLPVHVATKDYVDNIASRVSVTNPVNGSVGGLILWVGTQAEYNAIATKDAKTIYNVMA
jgi:hypothetical protein